MSDASPSRAEVDALLEASRQARHEADAAWRLMATAAHQLHIDIRVLVDTAQLALPEWAAGDLAAADARLTEWRAAADATIAAHTAWQRGANAHLGRPADWPKNAGGADR